jgi:hypothetical protein
LGRSLGRAGIEPATLGSKEFPLSYRPPVE